MRKPFVAGNWKMNKTVEGASALVKELLPEIQGITTVERVLCPPSPALMIVSAMLTSTGVGIGAQNMHWEAQGAFTGEISAQMVKELCQYVILGHSERRTLFSETDNTVNKKIKVALENMLTPIFCIGETLEENQTNRTAEIIIRQVKDGLAGLTAAQVEKLVIAYEPVWAIGTGLAASGAGANAVVKDNIRFILKEMFTVDVADSVRVLYGGSVTAANAAEFFDQPEIDGALVGGASLKPAEFIGIIKAAAR